MWGLERHPDAQARASVAAVRAGFPGSGRSVGVLFAKPVLGGLTDLGGGVVQRLADAARVPARVLPDQAGVGAFDGHWISTDSMVSWTMPSAVAKSPIRCTWAVASRPARVARKPASSLRVGAVIRRSVGSPLPGDAGHDLAAVKRLEEPGDNLPPTECELLVILVLRVFDPAEPHAPADVDASECPAA
jgi:hypothetical protein